MTDEKFMLVSLEDAKIKSLAEVLGNKTCKKIIDYLADNEEASQKDLSLALDIPMNTMEYNMKKLLLSGLVQKRKNFFWSKKGKKIVMYELSNKSIVISPKKSVGEKFKSLVPAFMLTGVLTFGVYVYEKLMYSSKQLIESPQFELAKVSSAGNSLIAAGASDSIRNATFEYGKELLYYPPSPLWTWFLAGALLVLFVVSIVNWRKL